jgi:thioredoxin reductase
MMVRWEVEPVATVISERGRLSGVRLEGGKEIPVNVIWTRPTPSIRNELAISLGCELEEKGGFAGFIQANQQGVTSVPGVFAVGDLVNPAPSVAFAVSSASFAAAMANHALIELDHAH